ncbi:hypothetical protein [Brevibacillus massiliensis]|uniref:hypothetical protein n=1 Tax=Brevibacillus massiliensis TaxID=1118054 RepID=UPI0002E76FFE|nr:hypothetical protein [Brevibacillus massiliensis]
MELKIMDRIYVYENNETVLDQLMNDVNQFMHESNSVIVQMDIDGQVVFDDYFEYISDRIGEIRKIEVISQSVEEFTNEVLMTANEYLERSLPLISLLSDEFYQGPKQETWEQFEQLIEGLQWMEQTVQYVSNNKPSCEQWQETFRWSTELAELEQAVIQQDAVLIGDILRYEILTRLEMLKKELEQEIHNGVINHDLN